MQSFTEAFYKFLQSMGYTHPVHPIFTYVPIGGVISALIFCLVALIWKRHSQAVTARHCIVLAFIFVFPTILLGYMDWQYFHGGSWLFAFKMKIILAAVLTILLFIAVLLHRKLEPDSKIVLFVYFLCFFTVTGLGYYGGEIVFGTQTRHDHEHDGHKEDSGKSDEKASFAQVSEIFDQSCVMCHKGENPPLGLRLQTYEQVMEGSENCPVVVPGKPGESELVLRIKGEAKPSMPFRQPLLPENKIQSIVKWVEKGSPGSPGHIP